MAYSIEERAGIINLLKTNRQNVTILLQLAKSATKNVIDVDTEEEALNTIFLHVPDTSTLLNKRIITKEILFKYLHKNKVPLTADFTKPQLINKTIDYWHETYDNHQHLNDCTNSTESIVNIDHKSSQISAGLIVSKESSEFPLNLLARKFSEWFFENYNNNTLKLDDFWTDSVLVLQISANDGIDEQICEDSNSLLEILKKTRQRFCFYFNPNLTCAGVQGRIDVHGLVLVLACGTLHTMQDCVGVFECVFGLIRDPFAENNWKSKNIKLILRSKEAPTMPSLEDSDTLRDVLKLPVPNGELT